MSDRRQRRNRADPQDADGAGDVPADAGRRRFLTLGAVAAVSAGGLPGRADAEALRRPNVLWLVSEDNNPWLGAYGDELAHTPSIDGLARDGILYRNVYSTAPVCAPSRFAIITAMHPETCSPAQHMSALARLPDVLRTFPEFLRAAGYYCSNNAKTHYNCDVPVDRVWDESSRTAHWRKRPTAAPFFSVFNFERTHESQLFDAKPGRVDPASVRVPAYLPDTPAIRREIANYYGLLERMDAEIGERLAELRADGLEDDTIVFYYSDNGGVLPRSKRYCYDEGLRVSLVVRFPPRWRHLADEAPGTQVTRPVTLMDLGPTVLSLAGLETPENMHGRALLGTKRRPAGPYAFGMRNRMDERIDMVRTVTDGRYRYLRNYMPHRPWGQHNAFEWLAKGYQEWERLYRAGRLTPEQARFFGTKPYEELYDLRSDPDEVRSLVDDAAHAPVLRRLRRALDEHMIAIHDNGFIPEGASCEGYFESRDPARYPLRRIMRIASAAARGDSRKLGLLGRALQDPNEVVRYWAAVGLLVLGVGAAGSRATLADAMRDDASVHVRIVAAEALGRLGEAAEPVRMLAAVADGDPQWQVRLAALNALTFIGPGAAEARDVVDRAAVSPNEYLMNAGRYLAAVLRGEYTPEYPVFDFAGFIAIQRQRGETKL
jgi:arylsulfatase A-like enzyme